MQERAADERACASGCASSCAEAGAEQGQMRPPGASPATSSNISASVKKRTKATRVPRNNSGRGPATRLETTLDPAKTANPTPTREREIPSTLWR